MHIVNLKEYNSDYNKVSSFVPWWALVAPGVIVNEDGSFMATFRYRGRDTASSTDYEMVAMTARINHILKLYGTGWCFYIEARRQIANGFDARVFPDIPCQLQENERVNKFNGGEYYEMEYYFTLQWLPPSETEEKFKKIFYVREDEQERDKTTILLENLDMFQTYVNKFYDAFASETYECEQLDDEGMLTYLHSCVSLSNHKIKVPYEPVCLGDMLCDTPFYGGVKPILGTDDNHKIISVLSIRSYPPNTYPAMLDSLNKTDIEFRWVTRFIADDKVTANEKLAQRKREWLANDKDFVTMIKEWVTKSESRLSDSSAILRSGDADAALVELQNDCYAFGWFTNHVFIYANSKDELKLKQRVIIRAFESEGFVVREETFNASQSWFGAIPGNAYADPRRDYIHTMNLCHMLPLSAVWAGSKQCKHLKAPAIARVKTVGSTPFFLNIHVGDVGHTMIIGPTGSGKSVFLNFLESQFRGLKNSRIYVFDKGGSSRVLSAMVEGRFYDLGDEDSENMESFQPFRHIDSENEKVWASEWVQEIFVQEGVNITPEVKRAIWNALTSLAETPVEERTITGFAVYLQDVRLRDALSPFMIETPGVNDTAGPYAALFDGNSDDLSLGAYQSFEMGELMNKKNAVLPTLSYLFHRIETDCHGEPTFIILDECWTFLDNPVFAEKIKEWLKTMRKNNVSIIFATQNLEDIRRSSISSAIIESCMTRFFLPNPQAIASGNDEVYGFFSLNDTERSIIANATPKMEYYYSSPEGRRLFSLGLSDYALSWLAASSKEDQAMCKHFLSTYPAEEFAEHWLEYKGQTEALDAYHRMKARSL